MLRKNDLWSVDILNGGLIVDLSKVLWVDFGAAAQLALLIHKAATSEIQVEVLFPSKNDETNNLEIADYDTARFASARTVQRIQSFEFLIYLRFVEAIQFRPKTGSWICPIVLSDGVRLEAGSLLETGTQTYSTKLAPLTWIDHEIGSTHRTFANFLSKVVSGGGDGLTPADASAFAGVIVHELVENVFKHSGGTRLALVSAWSRPKNHPINPGDFNDLEAPFLADASLNGISVIEIFVGDIGIGLIEKLSDSYTKKIEKPKEQKATKVKAEKVVEWAFERWSSSDSVDVTKRGVRGLYRVGRLASRYRGLINIQTHRVSSYRNFYSASTPSFFNVKSNRHYIPGTILRVRLFSVPKKLTNSFIKAIPTLLDTHESKVGVEIVSIGNLTVDGLAPEDRQAVINAVTSEESKKLNYLAILFSEVTFDKHRIEAALAFLSSVAAPNFLVVLGLPGSTEELRSSAHSVESVLHESNLDRGALLTVKDPILLISQSGEFVWIGVSSEQAAIYTLAKKGMINPEGEFSENLSEAFAPDVLQEALRRAREHPYVLRGHVGFLTPTEIFEKKPNDNFELTSVISRISASIAIPINNLTAEIKAVQKNNFKSIVTAYSGLRVGPFLTPSLDTVAVWIDLSRYLSKGNLEFSSNSVIMALAMKIRQSDINCSMIDAIFSDAGATLSYRDQFAESIGVGKVVDSDTQLAGDDVLAPFADKRPRVLVFSNLIASSETAKRTIVSAIRQGYEVSAVVAVLDTRNRPDLPIKVWGIDIEVHSLANTPTQLQGNFDVKTLMSPAWELEILNVTPPASETNFNEILASSKAFSRGHVVRPNGRHLTYVIDSTVLLSHIKIKDNLIKRIEAWSSVLSIEKTISPVFDFVVWTPVENRDETRWLELVRSLFSITKETRNFEVLPIRKSDIGKIQNASSSISEYLTARDKHVIIFDWGLVTGGTMTRLVRYAVRAKCRSVLSLSVLSQLPEDEAEFLASVSELTMNLETDRTDLFTEPTFSLNSVPVRFDWIETGFFGHFEGVNCPLCLQRTRIIASRPRTSFLQAYRRDEIEALNGISLSTAISKIAETRSRSGVIDPHYVDFYRKLFTKSFSSTRARLELKNALQNIRKTSHFLDSQQQIIALVSILADEPGWLKQPPLHFRELRQIIADLCIEFILKPTNTLQSRYEAVKVLRNVSKQRYIASLRDLFLAVISINSLVQVLFFGVFSILQKGYHEQKELLQPLAESLEQCLIKLDSVSNREEIWATRIAVADLHAECEFLLVRIGSRDISPAAAYSGLLHRLGNGFFPHSSPVEKMSWLIAAAPRKLIDRLANVGLTEARFSESERGVVGEWLRQCDERWQVCIAFLERRLIPRLQKILTTFDVREKIDGPDESDIRLVKAIAEHYEGSGYPQPLDLTKAIRTLSNCRDPIDFRGAELKSAWAVVKSELDWYAKAFFRPSGATTLYKIMSNVPADLLDCYKAGFDSADFDTETSFQQFSGATEKLKGVFVFCLRSVLIDLFGEIFRNMVKHQQPVLGGEKNSSIKYGISFMRLETSCKVLIFNDSLRPSLPQNPLNENRVHGLTLYREDIEKFGGQLIWGETYDIDKCRGRFTVSIELQLWKEEIQ